MATNRTHDRTYEKELREGLKLAAGSGVVILLAAAVLVLCSYGGGG